MGKRGLFHEEYLMKKTVFVAVFAVSAVLTFGQDVLVLAPMQNDGGIEDVQIRTLTRLLENALQRTRRFEIIDRGAVEDILKEHGFQLSDLADTRKTVELGKVLNANFLVRPSVMPLAGDLFLESRIVDANTSKILNSTEVRIMYDLSDAYEKLGDFAATLVGAATGGQTVVSSDDRAAAKEYAAAPAFVQNAPGSQAAIASKVVVVAPFKAENGASAADAATITETYSTQLSAAKAVRVVTRDSLDKVVREHGFQAGDWSKEAKVMALCKALNADWIIQGTVQKRGTLIDVTVRIVNSKTLTIMNSGYVQIDGIGYAYDGIKALISPAVLQTLAGG
jgi:TolB-like protein